MRTAKVTHDNLAVWVDFKRPELELLCPLLNELHELGMYQRLNMYRYCGGLDIEINDLASLKGFIKLYTNHTPSKDKLLKMEYIKSLQEIHVVTTKEIVNLEAVATNLENLERIHVRYASFEHIVLFIKKSIKLREIIIESFDTAGLLREFNDLEDMDDMDDMDDIEHCDEEPTFIDLLRLNRERSKLPNAEKVTLYVNERMYLATKWAINEIDLEFVTLKRTASFIKDNDFDFW